MEPATVSSEAKQLALDEFSRFVDAMKSQFQQTQAKYSLGPIQDDYSYTYLADRTRRAMPMWDELDGYLSGVLHAHQANLEQYLGPASSEGYLSLPGDG